MSSEKFEALDEELQVVVDKIQDRFSNGITRVYGEERKQLFQEVQRWLDEARQTIFEMEAEARAAPVHFRMDMIAKTRTYREKITQFSLQHKSLTTAESRSSVVRQSLFEGGPSGSQQFGTDQNIRRAVNEGQAVLQRTSDSIYRSTQVAFETEQIGTEVIQELGTQRETLVRTQNRLIETDVEIGRSRKILNSMYRRVITNKLILILVIVLEIAILAGVIYYRFFS